MEEKRRERRTEDTSSEEGGSDSTKKKDEEKDRHAGHEARAGIYSTAPDLFEGFGPRISRIRVDSFLFEGCSTADTAPPFWFLSSADPLVTFDFVV